MRDRRSDLPDPLVRELRSIGADRASGAYALSVRAIRALASAQRRIERLDPTRVRRVAEAIARELGRTQPAMGAFQEWSRRWQRASRSLTPLALRRWIRSFVRATRRALEEEGRGMTRHLRADAFAGRGVVTYSRSDAVERALRSLTVRQRPRDVAVLESRPGGEGRSLFRSLRRVGVPARLVPDRHGTASVVGAGLLLIGADAVYADGSVVHKRGTRPLAIAARAHGIPVIVIAGSSKWVRRRRPTRRLPPLFDRTPARCVSEYWTDRGRRRGRGARLRPRRA